MSSRKTREESTVVCNFPTLMFLLGSRARIYELLKFRFAENKSASDEFQHLDCVSSIVSTIKSVMPAKILRLRNYEHIIGIISLLIRIIISDNVKTLFFSDLQGLFQNRVDSKVIICERFFRNTVVNRLSGQRTKGYCDAATSEQTQIPYRTVQVFGDAIRSVAHVMNSDGHDKCAHT